MSLSEITPVVLTYNEEANIGRTLGRLRWANRVVVIDSFSTDRTLEIARQYANVEVIQRAFDDHTTQWNFGLTQAVTEWTLTLDADYCLDAGWEDEADRVTNENRFDGFFSSFTYCIQGRRLRATLYPPRLVLFRRARGSYVPDGHTQVLELKGKTSSMNSRILHDDRKPLGAWLQAQERYATLEARKLNDPARVCGWKDEMRRTRWLATLVVLPYCLFIKGLVFDGWPGWYYALQRIYAELLLNLHLLDLPVGDKPPVVSDTGARSSTIDSPERLST
jgi:glycosyltransferase involved in cell wall biosynthesis